MIPLDDLLPKNDDAYEPPGDLSDLFTCGGPAWELADRLKWRSAGDEAFSAGWQAGLFELGLKTGLPFMMPVPTAYLPDFVQRAKAFNRACETLDQRGDDISLKVGGHTG